MRFEWDAAKNRRNIDKHGVSFERAARIFDGPTLDRVDDREDYGEHRVLSLGEVDGVAILAVAHTDRNGVIRIISARRATRTERLVYEEKIRKAAHRR